MSLQLYFEIMRSLGIKEPDPVVEGLPSWFDVSGLAEASVAAAAVQVAAISDLGPQNMNVDRRLCGLWFGWSLRPQGWAMPNPWDPIAGDYKARDGGWIRLHTNAPHHRAAAPRVLGTPQEKEAVSAAVAQRDTDELEGAVVEAGGCAAAMRSLEEWAHHPHGQAIAAEPLIYWSEAPILASRRVAPHTARPLDGVRVLDLTRVLAGPVATRFLAAFGANVLRVDPPSWDEPGVIPEVTIGKRCAGLDLHDADDRNQFTELLRTADILVHGYRPAALEGLGFGKDQRRQLNPELIDVCLDAYGWTGPWARRRGFDSLVQMSAGIADAGMRMEGLEKPCPLPVQALDQATGYLMAAAVARALLVRRVTGAALSAQLSLARTAHLLASTLSSLRAPVQAPETSDDLAPEIELTDWGAARRFKFPVSISGALLGSPLPACKLRSSPPSW
jgi:crotonobetainyl-CoA:carnitine CoA-transferase CaiB-like acyl-CoA transferase